MEHSLLRATASITLGSGLANASMGAVALLTALASASGAVLLPLADLTWHPRDIALVGGYGAALLGSLLCREALLALGQPPRATSAGAGGALGQLGLVAALLAGGVSAPRAYLAVMLTGSLAQAAIACRWLRRQHGPPSRRCRAGAGVGERLRPV